MMQSEPSFTIEPIGYVENTCNDLIEPGLIRELESRIRLKPEWVDGLYGLEDYKQIMVVFYFHRLAGEEIELIQHRRGKVDQPRRGVFALHSPRRPNAIGVTEVDLLKIEGGVLTVTGLDAVNGTPVLDIKSVRRK